MTKVKVPKNSDGRCVGQVDFTTDTRERNSHELRGKIPKNPLSKRINRKLAKTGEKLMTYRETEGLFAGRTRYYIVDVASGRITRGPGIVLRRLATSLKVPHSIR